MHGLTVDVNYCASRFYMGEIGVYDKLQLIMWKKRIDGE